jgi:hypothetical protein
MSEGTTGLESPQICKRNGLTQQLQDKHMEVGPQVYSITEGKYW